MPVLTEGQIGLLMHAREMTIRGAVEIYYRDPERYRLRLIEDRELARAAGCLTYEHHTNCVEFYDEVLRRLGLSV